MRLKNRAILLSLCLCFQFLIGSAQPSFTTSDSENALKLSKSILAVVVKEKEEKLLKRLIDKPDKLKAYEESIDGFNLYIKKAFEKEWNLSEELKFISETEAEKLKEAKDANHFLAEITEIKNYKIGDFYSPNPKMGDFNSPRYLAYHLTQSGKTIALSIAPASRPNRDLAIAYLPAAGVSLGATTFMVLNLKNQITDCINGINSLSDLKRDINKRELKLKEKTLLIFNPLISKALQKAIDKKEVSEFYPFPYEITSFEKADEIIVSKNSKYAYIWTIPAGASTGSKPLFNYFIIDAGDGRILYMTGVSVIGANGDFHPVQLRMAAKQLK